MAGPRQVDDGRPSKWKARQSPAGAASLVNESEEAGDVGGRGQRGPEGQRGMLAGIEGENGKDAHRDLPLRTALPALSAAQPFKEQVILATFKLLQNLGKRCCGPKGTCLLTFRSVQSAKQLIPACPGAVVRSLNPHLLQKLVEVTSAPGPIKIKIKSPDYMHTYVFLALKGSYGCMVTIFHYFDNIKSDHVFQIIIIIFKYFLSLY